VKVPSEDIFMSDDMSGRMNVADIMAMLGGNGANSWMNNPFIWMVFLVLFGNGGFGFGNNGRGNVTAQGELTRAEMVDGFNNQNLQNDVRSAISAITQGFADTNYVANTNANMINQSINNLGAQTQMGFCTTNGNIDSLKYEMAQNCCDIKNALHTEGELTRGLITQNTIQELRDKLSEKDNTLQSAQLALANANQTQNILNSLGRFVPYAGSNPCSPCTTNQFPCCTGTSW
jgi:hypothetical protein